MREIEYWARQSSSGAAAGPVSTSATSSRRSQEDRVALTDVACEDRPIAWSGQWPQHGVEKDRADDPGPGADPHDDREDQHRTRARARSHRTATSHHDDDPDRNAHHGQDDHARPALEPRHRPTREARHDLGGRRHPRRGNPREGGQPRGDQWDAGGQAGHQSENRTGGGCGTREDVGDDAVHRHRRCHEHQQRATGQLRRERDR